MPHSGGLFAVVQGAANHSKRCMHREGCCQGPAEWEASKLWLQVLRCHAKPTHTIRRADRCNLTLLSYCKWLLRLVQERCRGRWNNLKQAYARNWRTTASKKPISQGIKDMVCVGSWVRLEAVQGMFKCGFIQIARASLACALAVLGHVPAIVAFTFAKLLLTP